MLQILKQKIVKDNQELYMISIKLEGLANYILVLQKNLFSEIMVTDFIKMMTDYIILDDPEIQIMNGDDIPSEKIIEYLLK